MRDTEFAVLLKQGADKELAFRIDFHAQNMPIVGRIHIATANAGY